MNKLFSILFIFTILISLLKTEINAAENVYLKFFPENLIADKGSIVASSITLGASNEKIIGVDLVIKYDPAKAEIVKVEDKNAFSFKAKEIIDNGSGIAKIAYSNDYGKTSSGTAEITKIYFRIKSDSGFIVNFDFVNGKTSDTNVVNEAGADVLISAGSVTVGNYNTTGNSSSDADTKVPNKSDTVLPSVSEVDSVVLSPSDERFVFPGNIISEPDVLGKADESENKVGLGNESGKVIIVLWFITLLSGLFLLVYIIKRQKNLRNPLFVSS